MCEAVMESNELPKSNGMQVSKLTYSLLVVSAPRGSDACIKGLFLCIVALPGLSYKYFLSLCISITFPIIQKPNRTLKTKMENK